MMRNDPVARRSFVTVSAMPDDSHPSSGSPLTFAKPSTPMEEMPVPSGAVVVATGACATDGAAGSSVSTGAMKR